MENATYTALTRQSGLMNEMRVVANNIANLSTTGFRSEGVIFAEHVKALGPNDPSLSMATASARETLLSQGTLTQTGGSFDLAIEGDGFFLVATPQGERLTRAGAFTPNENGDLVTPEGYNVLDAGGAPVFIPQGAGPIGIAPDGTVSAGGQPVAQVGLVNPINLSGMVREDGVRFRADDGYDPALEGRMLQGFIEESNVDPVLEISRMIEVQRAYELGQSFLDKEDERIRSAIRALGQ
ncbi:flagellar basal-body rod protein FlgF [Octadecabacter temperatus]|uniref:Flagellar basal-body rod protein FlgF n=1 Tax=Octadecabacter temperatus TaxID=1458307 RepID=A0A0K0YA43_9RHOB|nr:flagellar hook-basal body complex protein [Octadecabacter temperatus]AKS47803.1 Flagellar basal-body rod protein FlgG [Octadecabacter temperatus]SIO38264.1 flagellar basal-body rod protein FlgF [Octadecabacter temperatus]